MATKIEDGKILLYDKNGRVIERVFLSSYNQTKIMKKTKQKKEEKKK